LSFSPIAISTIRVLAVFVEEAAAVAYAGKLCEGEGADCAWDASPCKRHRTPNGRRHAPTGHRDATWASLELLPVRRGLGDVTLVRVLGDGSSGHAHLARTTDGQTVVVKICGVRLSEHVPYARDAAAEYNMEHRILGAMNGRDGLFPELLSYGRFVNNDGRWFIYTVLSHIPGTTLCDIVDASLCGEQPIPRDYADRIMGDVETAIALLHDAGFVHRDLHDGNVLVKPDGHAVLIDFNWSTDDKRKRNVDLESLCELNEILYAGSPSQ
jgi:serine/threonine protein kinase